MMSTNVLVSTFAPFHTISLSLPSSENFSSILSVIHDRYPELPLESVVLSTHGGMLPADDTTLSVLGGDFICLRISPRILGGKGGFGSQLRAAGGRMSSQKTNNNDSCRDLNGRRLSTLKEAKKLAEYMNGEPERQAAKVKAQKDKLEALERKLGIDPNASKDASGEPSNKKRRFDDTEYIEQSRELVEGVKNAVSAALLKKKKKPKLSNQTADENEEKPVLTTSVPKDGSAEFSQLSEQPLSKEKESEKLVRSVAPLDAVGA